MYRFKVGVQVLFALMLLVTIQSVMAIPVYYSVGTNAADLKSGTPTMGIASGVATLSSAQPDIIGVGDQITYNGSTVCYISGRTSATVYSVITATGASPANVSGATVNSIKRAFNSLSGAEANATDAAHLNTADLVAGNFIIHLACYGDGVDSLAVTVDGYTTGAGNYIRIFTPVSSNEVGTSQRHDGKWKSSGAYGMDNKGIGTGKFINILDDHVRIDGLQIYAYSAVDYMDAINVTASASSDVRVSNCVIKGGTVKGGSGLWIPSSGVVRVYNNIIYDFIRPGVAGHGMVSQGGTLYAYNNTMYNNYINLNNMPAATLVAKNNLCYASTLVGGNFYGTITGNNNLSGPGTDAQIPATGARNGIAVLFADSANDDFRLASTDAGARNLGADLSADANLSFANDIDGFSRGAEGAWDIGADETVADAQNPVVSAITAPAGGAQWFGGSTRSVTYTTSDNVGVTKCSLQVSYNNGTSWSHLGQGTAASFSWDVPSNTAPASQCLVRVTAYDAAGNASAPLSSGVFQIIDMIPPSVTVTSPNGGEAWPADGTKDIRWNASDNIAVAKCSLYYSLNNSTWTAIAEVSGAGGTYAWHLPSSSAPTAWVKVIAIDGSGLKSSDISNASFSITTKPYFTSPDSVSVEVNKSLLYAITYDNGGLPGDPEMTLLSKPKWVFYAGTLLSGKAPNTEMVDTVHLQLELGGAKDTIHIKIHVYDPNLPGIRGMVKTSAMQNLQYRESSGHLEFLIHASMEGSYELELYELNGRSLMRQQHHLFSGTSFSMTCPMPQINGIYIAVLKGPGYNTIRKIKWLH